MDGHDALDESGQGFVVTANPAHQLLLQLCGDLRLLWSQAGGPTLRALSGRVRLSKSQVSNILNGRVRQLPDWRVVSALVTSFDTYAQDRGRTQNLSVSVSVEGFWRPRYTVVEHAFQQAQRDRGNASVPAGKPSREWVVQRQLPAVVRQFVGRTNELEMLTKLINNGDTKAVVISAIDGTAGIGKTALAIHWAHSVAERFPDGQLYVNLRGFDPSGPPMSPAETLRTVLESLSVPPEHIPSTVDAMAGLYRTLLVGRRILVILDNARDAEQVRPLLPGTPTALVVVTSRRRLTSLVAVNGAHPITLDLLSPSQARELLASRLGLDRTVHESAAVDRIITACARLPLALSIVAARAATYPNRALSTLADELADAGTRLDALDTGDAAADVRSAFSWSYDRLSRPAARLFRLLGLHPGPDIDASAAASLIGEPTAAGQLAELTQAHLLADQAGRYTLHDLLRAYAAELTLAHDGEPERQQALLRMLEHYARTAQAAGSLLTAGREVVVPADDTGIGDRDEALSWFVAERPVLLGTVTLAAEAGLAELACQLAWLVSGFLHLRGRWQERADALRTALAAAQRSDDRVWQARIHRDLAGALSWLDQFDEALIHTERALELHAELGDEIGAARTHRSACLLMERWGRYEQALEHARRSLDLYTRNDDLAGRAYAFNGVGWYQTLVGSYADALDNCRRAVSLLGQLGHLSGEANAWDSLGYAHHHLGDHVEAIRCYQRAVKLCQDIGDRYFEARSLDHIGDALNALGRAEHARRSWRRCLAILDEMQPAEAQAVRAKLGDQPFNAPERNPRT
jgi:tetratricopeptide (TPR) repeat protein